MKPITIALKKVRCIEETDGAGSDEPYVVVFTADISAMPPGALATLYGPWEDVDTGETAATIVPPESFPPWMLDPIHFLLRRNCWGTGRQPAIIHKPSDVIILVALMECDDGNPLAAEAVVQTSLFTSMIASMSAHLSRAALVSRLKEDMASALKLTAMGLPSSDKPIGGIEELALTTKDLEDSSSGMTKTLHFSGSGGKYDLVFTLKQA